jgi:hypothetical protein
MIDQYPSANGVLTSLIWRKTMSGGETSLSGYDNASQALSYTPGQEQVYLNGILLVRGDDYTATNGTSITGLAALAASDFVQINCYNNFSVASLPVSGLVGTIANNQLQNSAITINGSAISLGGSVTLAGDIESVTATSPLTGGGSTGALTVGIQEASTSQRGSVQLSDSISTTSSVLAATPTAVKSAYDLANGAIPKTLTTTTGDIIYASAANTPARLGIGSTDQILKVTGGVPVWATPSAGAPAWTRIANGTLSGTTVSVSGINAAEILISLPNWAQGGSTAPMVRVNNDSGSNYGVQNNETNSGIQLWGSATTGGNSFCYINGANTTATMKFGLANLYPSYIKNSSAFTSVQIVSGGGSGTWSSGNYEVWTR